MSNLLDFSTIASSAIGSLIAGLLFLSSAPLWLKWIKSRDTTKLKGAVKGVLVFSLIGAILVLCIWALDHMEKVRTPSYHPTLPDGEAAEAFLECDMESIEATASIISRSERNSSRIRHRANCLLIKGFKFD